MPATKSLQELRQQQGLTQDQFAEIVGVDTQVIKDIEAGKPVDWMIATSIAVKISNYIGNRAIEGLTIPQKRN